MNKTFCKKSNLINFLLAGCLILFNLIFVLTSCGLDTYYVIEPPYVNRETSYSSIEESENYFEFQTREDQDSGIKFLGTEVYYKIYDSTSKLSSEYTSINSAASSETSANQSASRLIETYKFQPLRSSDNPGATILVPVTGTGKNRTVRIRLSNYFDYIAEFTVDKTRKGVPVRSIPKNPTFSFKEEMISGQLPKGGENADADYGYSTTEAVDAYYVSLFAVSVAQDSTYAWLYSNVVALGSVKISLE